MTSPAPTLIRASAGTGKTTALVDHYVRLLQENDWSPANVVAITYTRKAAQDLARRIDLRLRQAGASAATLAALARAPIGNFHGLALRWLEPDGWLGGGGPVGEVLSGADEDRALFRQSAERAWFAKDSQVSQDVAYVAESCRLDPSSFDALWNACSEAREEGRTVDGSLLGSDYQPEALGREAQDDLAASRASIARARAEPGAFNARNQAEADGLLSLPVPDRYEPTADWRRRWLAFAKAINGRTQVGRLLGKATLDRLRDWPALCEAEEAARPLRARWARLLAAAWDAYEADKRERRVLDFSDLLNEAVRRLEGDADAHGRLRQEVRAVLVDEAQDVNEVQRQLLHLLVGLRGPARALAPPAEWVVVGDWKQCIFGFRGANARMFERLAEDVRQAGGSEQTLATNYRSLPAVLTALNAIGTSLFDAAYAPLALGAKDEGGPDVGCIGYPVSDAADGEEDDAPTSAWAEAKATARLARDAIDGGRPPAQIAILCRALKSRGPLLLRALSDEGVPVASQGSDNLLEAPNVQQWLALGAWLSAPAPARLLALAEGLRSPWCGVSDDALLALLGADGRALEAPVALARGDAGPWLQALPASVHVREADSLRALAATIGEAQEVLDRFGAAEALEWCIDAFGWRARAWQMERPAEAHAQLAQLLALAERDDARGDSHARHFWLRHWQRSLDGEREDAALAAGAPQGAVTLCSVHRAKGLEWDHVILPLIGREAQNRSSALEFDRELGLGFSLHRLTGRLQPARFRQIVQRRKQGDAEELERLLYVATSRARRRLDILIPSRVRSRTRHFHQHLAGLWEQRPAWWREGSLPVAVPPGAPATEGVSRRG